jgi:hypothetical protein
MVFEHGGRAGALRQVVDEGLQFVQGHGWFRGDECGCSALV